MPSELGQRLDFFCEKGYTFVIYETKECIK